jgi:hypothetical protein
LNFQANPVNQSPMRLRFLGLGLGLVLVAVNRTSAQTSTNKLNRLIVIAPAAFHSALDEFVTHKRKRLVVDLYSLQQILSHHTGVDDPERLKHFLFEQWRTQGLRYVLLVGDVDVMPVRFMVLDRVTPAAFDYAFYPSDLYYGDLARRDGTFDDWNGRKDSFHAGYFGEVRGEKNKRDPINFDQVDYRPEIAVGRWPVSTPEEVRLVASKTLGYELACQTNQDGAFRRAALLAVGGWVDSRPLMERLAGSLEKNWQVEKRYYADASQSTVTKPPSHQQVCDLFNQGVGLVVHTGHGQSDGWEQCFSMGDLASLHNSSRLPIVISAGCSTAYFAPLPPYGPYVDVAGKKHAGTDSKEVFRTPPPPPSPYQHGRFNPTGLGEQFLKAGPNGAVAYIGCNTGSQPCALTLAEGFVTAIARPEGACLGDCWVSAVRFYFEKERLATLKPNDDWYPASIFFQGMKFMLFGDPSLQLPRNGPL